MEPHEQAPWIVLGVHAAAEAAQIAHGGVDDLEERARNENVRIDEDQHVARGLAHSSVARSANALYRLVNHSRVQIAGNRRGPVRAVVVDDDDFDADPGPRPQVVCRGSDRLECRRQPGFFVECGDDHRDHDTCCPSSRRESEAARDGGD